MLKLLEWFEHIGWHMPVILERLSARLSLLNLQVYNRVQLSRTVLETIFKYDLNHY
jgi:hypothetical protein